MLQSGSTSSSPGGTVLICTWYSEMFMPSISTTFGKTFGLVSSRTMASEALNISWLVTLKAARLTRCAGIVTQYWVRGRTCRPAKQ